MLRILNTSAPGTHPRRAAGPWMLLVIAAIVLVAIGAVWLLTDHNRASQSGAGQHPTPTSHP